MDDLDEMQEVLALLNQEHDARVAAEAKAEAWQIIAVAGFTAPPEKRSSGIWNKILTFFKKQGAKK